MLEQWPVAVKTPGATHAQPPSPLDGSFSRARIARHACTNRDWAAKHTRRPCPCDHCGRTDSGASLPSRLVECTTCSQSRVSTSAVVRNVREPRDCRRSASTCTGLCGSGRPWLRRVQTTGHATESQTQCRTVGAPRLMRSISAAGAWSAGWFLISDERRHRGWCRTSLVCGVVL